MNIQKISAIMSLQMVFFMTFITVCPDAAAEPNAKPVLIVQNSANITYKGNFKYKQEFQVSLLKGVKKSVTVCKGSFNSSYQPFSSTQSIRCLGNPTESNVTFYLSGLTENHTDIYFFCKEDMYPPPLITSLDNGTVIHVKGPAPKQEIEKSQSQPFWPLLLSLGVSVVYSIFITAAFCYVMRKRKKNRILQSEYINVVPRRPKQQQAYNQNVLPPRCR